MPSHIRPFLTILFVFLFLPFVAFAQDAAAAAPADPQWVGLVIAGLGAIAGSSFISAFVSSDRWWMRIIDALALNFLKARNDPRIQ